MDVLENAPFSTLLESMSAGFLLSGFLRGGGASIVTIFLGRSTIGVIQSETRLALALAVAVAVAVVLALALASPVTCVSCSRQLLTLF